MPRGVAPAPPPWHTDGTLHNEIYAHIKSGGFTSHDTATKKKAPQINDLRGFLVVGGTGIEPVTLAV